MSTSHKRSELQIYDADTRSSTVTIAAALTKTSFKSSVPLEIEPALALKHADGDFPDVAEKLHSIDAEFVTRAATAKSQSDAVQTSLTTKVNAINVDIGTFQSDLATEIAEQQAAQAADANARTALETHLETQVDDEEALAKEAEEANELSINQLNTTRATQVSDEEDARTLAINNVQSQLDFAKANSDPAAIDSISELLNLMNGDPDSSVLAQINDVRADITAMQHVVNILTNNPSLGVTFTSGASIPNSQWLGNVESTTLFQTLAEAEVAAAADARALGIFRRTDINPDTGASDGGGVGYTLLIAGTDTTAAGQPNYSVAEVWSITRI